MPTCTSTPAPWPTLRAVLEARPAWALVGPRIYDEDGKVYPSVRRFPSFIDAAGHALFALFNPENRFTKRYNPGAPMAMDVVEADWISGSCFLARRSALEELGGFDEAYFMYAEDMDLCWRAHRAGWGVGFAGAADVTHIQGVSTARHPYRMMVAHHRSALRFTVRTTSGWRRAALPLAAAVLGLRMALATRSPGPAAGLAAGTVGRPARRRVVATSLFLGVRVASPQQPRPGRAEVNFALPPTTAGCGGATALAGGANRIPITVSTVAGQVAEMVNVCIDGRGPYPFVIDSGAGESIIDARLAARLHLAHDGSATEFDGVGCTGTAQPVEGSVMVGGGRSAGCPELTAATLPDFGGAGHPVGLLGSDVLSRFGAVRIDFTAQTLTFGRRRGTASARQRGGRARADGPCAVRRPDAG